MSLRIYKMDRAWYAQARDGQRLFYDCDLLSERPVTASPGEACYCAESGSSYRFRNDAWEVPSGSTGPEGPQGEIGPQGIQGIQGVQGDPGPAGEDGADGAAGNNGAPGADGATAAQVAALVYPVGAIYISTVGTNPATFLGFGTWAAFGAGRVMVGYNASDPDFDTAEETGGSKTHTLTTAEMPSHTHVQDSHTHVQDAHTHVQNSHNHTQDAHSHVVTSQTATTGGATSYEHGTLDTSSAEAEATETTATTVATNQAATAVNQNATAVNQSATAVNQGTGGGAAHPVMNPFIVVHLFKRTA